MSAKEINVNETINRFNDLKNCQACGQPFCDHDTFAQMNGIEFYRSDQNYAAVKVVPVRIHAECFTMGAFN